jgi:large subunit ribosomal protein L19
MPDVTHLLNLEARTDLPEIHPGDTVKVSWKVVEGDRVRTQTFQGFILRIKKAGSSSSITVRRVFQSVGVERTFLLYSPRLEKIEVTRQGAVRRAKLYYLRGRTGRAARIKEAGGQGGTRGKKARATPSVEADPSPS